jgi:hypothetical protein
MDDDVSYYPDALRAGVWLSACFLLLFFAALVGLAWVVCRLMANAPRRPERPLPRKERPEEDQAERRRRDEARWQEKGA